MAQNDGSVTGRPAWFLRLDGLVLLVGSLLLFSKSQQHWWWVPLLILAPDISMLGYLVSAKFGAAVYNLGHTYLLPMLAAFFGFYRHHGFIFAIGLIWLAHIGMDRAAGYGLKYDDAFKHTHLGALSNGK